MPAGRFSGPRFTPSAGDWSPLSLPNLRGWYDPTDASMFSFSSGTTVSAWNDKSGNAFHLPSVNGAPNRNVTINGLDAVNFDGNDACYTSSGAILDDEITMFGVIRSKSGSTSFPTMFQPVGATGGPALYGNNQAFTAAYVSNGFGSDWDSGFVLWPGGVDTTALLVVQTGASSVARKNGVQTGTGSNGTGTPDNGLRIGGDRAAAAFLSFYCGEIFFANGHSTTDDITAAEAYLNGRWAVY